MSRRFDRAPGATLRADEALVRTRIGESIDAKRDLLTGDLADRAAELAELLVACMTAGGKVLLFGNGGSAADATHLAAEFVGRFRRDRAPLPALSLSDNASSLSGIGNDYGYEEVFARQVRAFGQPGDVAVGMTTSGNSPNVVAGLIAARERDMRTAVLTGPSGLVIAEAELCLSMPVRETERIQECHMLVGHIVCELVEQAIFPAVVVP